MASKKSDSVSNGNMPKAGYGNGGIESMAQFDKLCDKIGNSLKNLEFTRDMIKKLAESEKQSAKSIATILNTKNKSLRFSVVDQAIQNFWKKQESNRRHFANALQTKIIQHLDDYITNANQKRKKLQKENKKVQNLFIECKKETTKQKQISLKEWQKLEEQIQKNDAYKKQNKLGKIKDLKPLQDKCSKAFAKYESYIGKLNELEQMNHEQACSIGELLHESQKYASERLSMHYNMVVSTKKFNEEFIRSNKSIVQSKAPPLNDILWRWLTYPTNHQTHTLPCTSNEVFQKTSIGQSFKRRVEPDFQDSKFLKVPNKARSPRQSPSKKSQPSSSSASSPSPSPQQTKSKKSKKVKKPKHKKESQPPSQPQPQPAQTQVDDAWDVDFGADDGGFADTPQQTQPSQQQQQSPPAQPTTNGGGFDNGFADGFDNGFDDNFANFDDNNTDLKIAEDNNNANASNMNGGGFADDWNTNFDEDAFASNNNEVKQDNNDDVDALFAASAAQDIFGDGGGGKGGGDTKTADTNTNGGALFADDFGGDDIFGTNDDAKPKGNDNTNDNVKNGGNITNGGDDAFNFGDDDMNMNMNGNTKNEDMANMDHVDGSGGGGLFDDEFDDDQAIEFPEFDMNATTKATKKRKSKLNDPMTVNAFPEPSPLPNNEITNIPEPVISFDAPQPAQSSNHEEADNDNPFGNDPFGGDDDGDDNNDNDDDEVDADNPFAMFEEPDTNEQNADNGDAAIDDFDPFS